jgi:diguanylate cyclase (GGDEF)-like protein
MQFSIGKLATLTIGLLIAVTIISTGVGLYVLQSNYRTLEERHVTEAQDSVRNTAIALHHQIRFYQGIQRLTAADPDVGGLPESGDKSETTHWTQATGGLLQGMLRQHDRLVLLDGNGSEKLSVGTTGDASAVGIYRTRVPDTPWHLILHRPLPASSHPLPGLVITGALILTVAGVLVAFMFHIIRNWFRLEMARVHQALQDVIEDRYQPSAAPIAIKEARILLPDIEQLALKIRQQRNKLGHQSLSDPLTGIFNRRYFDLMLAHLHEQSQRQPPSTLVTIDLNDFKYVNDEFGHAEGDRVLQQMAGYLQSRVRATDIVARLGGDEFALLLNNMSGDVLEDWLAALVHDYDHQILEHDRGGRVFCQFSIGVAQIDAQLYASPAEVFSAADSAMYSVKQRRRIRHSRYAIARPGNVTPITTAKGAL